MKRIYAMLALLGGVFASVSSNAQHVDLQALVDVDSGACLKLGQTFTPTSPATGDSVTGAWGVLNNGPDPMLSTDIIWLIDPTCKVSSAGIQVYGAPSRDAEAGELAVAFSYMSIDSINTLINFETADTATLWTTLTLSKPDFEPGGVYGFFFNVRGFADDFSGIDPEVDTVPNNFTIVPIRWNDCATSIDDMIVGKEKVSLVTYPNPTSDNISFDYNFYKATNIATARIADITGRTVLVKEFGKNTPGKETFRVDVSSLAPGMYIMEFSTDDKRAVSKFSVKR